jgi:hypothetical protein
MKKTLFAAPVLFAVLSGCAVVPYQPAPVASPYYVQGTPVYAASPPVYVGPPVYFRFGFNYIHRSYRHAHRR